MHDGVTIGTVEHFGRRIPAELRTALELGAAPEFDGVTGSAAGCDRRYGLEWHHRDPVAHGGACEMEKLEAGCAMHHQAETERQRRAGLLSPRRANKSPP